MIVFTVLGVLFFWCICWQIGYHFAMHLDIRRGIQAVFEPVDNTLADLVQVLAVFSEHKAKA